MTVSTGGRVRLVYEAPSGAKRVGTVHRNTCDHIPAGATTIPAERVDGDALLDATRKTCCSPRMFDVRNAITAGDTTTTKENTAMTATKSAAKAPAKKAATKPAADKAAKQAAAVKPKRQTVGTFEVGSKETHKCQGKCGKTLPVKKFPTTGKDGHRAVECRPCRDDRTKAEKAARAAAKAKAK